MRCCSRGLSGTGELAIARKQRSAAPLEAEEASGNAAAIGADRGGAAAIGAGGEDAANSGAGERFTTEGAATVGDRWTCRPRAAEERAAH